jgi:hypothetical protein
MNPNDVIQTYVAEVMRRLPGRERREIGLELHGLLGEMLADRAESAGTPADDAMVLAMLREFGTPAQVAERYHPAGTVIIPATQTRSFALFAFGGVALQWALTLPRVFGGGQPLVAWWFSAGLGALWWPGLMVMSALVAALVRARGWQPAWQPRMVDPDRVNRPVMLFGLVWFALGVALMISLPWIAPILPGPLPQVFAFDDGFLSRRAWPVLLLWSGTFALQLAAYAQGRWSTLTRRLSMLSSLAWAALLLWWIAVGGMFQARATDDGARGALGLVVLIIVIELAYRLYRARPSMRRLAAIG